MTAVSAASVRAGISLGDFNFTLGNLSKADSVGISNFPAIQMNLKTIGSTVGLKDFLNELYKTAPLVEVMSIKQSGDGAVLVLQFFYKPFPAQGISDDMPISKLSAKDLNLLSDLNSWNNVLDATGSSDFIQINLSTSSADLNSGSAGSASSQTNFSPFQ